MDWIPLLSGLFGFAFSLPGPLDTVRIALAGILVFLLPGFAWGFLFFRKIAVIERVALSLALSIALVTLSFLFLSRIVAFKITWLSSVLVIIGVTILPVITYYLNRVVRRWRGKSS